MYKVGIGTAYCGSIMCPMCDRTADKERERGHGKIPWLSRCLVLWTCSIHGRGMGAAGYVALVREVDRPGGPRKVKGLSPPTTETYQRSLAWNLCVTVENDG
jgi:hypothetical protein